MALLGSFPISASELAIVVLSSKLLYITPPIVMGLYTAYPPCVEEYLGKDYCTLCCAAVIGFFSML